MPSLAISFSDWNLHDPAPEPGRRSDFIVRGAHIVTPAPRGTTHYFWMAAFDVPSLTEEVAEKPRNSVMAAFHEDKHLLEKLQASVAADPRTLDFLEVTLGADGTSIKVRQILNKKLKAEGRALGLIRLPVYAMTLFVMASNAVMTSPAWPGSSAAG